MKNKKALSSTQTNNLLQTLKDRFTKNMQRHKNIEWLAVEKKIKSNAEKLWSLNEMEKTGGEPDVVDYDKKNDAYYFYDCADESPAGRRSLCYDREALDSRKENKPIGNAMEMADDMGIEILNEQQYRALQQLGKFDTKTSSWLSTPENIRKQGGAIFGDYRYSTVFVYHNGVQSYYAARGFRGVLKV